MRTKSALISDFYDQLALLVESDFPLPDSLRRLAQSLPDDDVRKVMDDMRVRVSHGEKLSEVMSAYPDHFDRLHVQLVSAGESTDSLADILRAIARQNRFEQFLVAKAKEILTYPLFVLHLAALLFLGVSVFLMPVFETAYSHAASVGATTPWFIAFSLKTCALVRQAWVGLAAIQVVFLAATFWLYSGTVGSHRAMVRVLNRLPGMAGVTRTLDSARVCAMCRLFFDRRLPIADALRATAMVVSAPATRDELSDIARRNERGDSLVEAFSEARHIDPLIAHVIKFKPEEHHVVALGELQTQYEQNVMIMVRDAAVTWTVIGIAVMTFVALFMALMVFVPVVTVHQPIYYLI